MTKGSWVGASEILVWTFCVVFFFPNDVNAMRSLIYFCPWSPCVVKKQGSF